MQRFPWLVTVLCSALALALGLLLERGSEAAPPAEARPGLGWRQLMSHQQRTLEVLERIEQRLGQVAPKTSEGPAVPALAPAEAPWSDLIQGLDPPPGDREGLALRSGGGFPCPALPHRP